MKSSIKWYLRTHSFQLTLVAWKKEKKSVNLKLSFDFLLIFFRPPHCRGKMSTGRRAKIWLERRLNITKCQKTKTIERFGHEPGMSGSCWNRVAPVRGLATCNRVRRMLVRFWLKNRRLYRRQRCAQPSKLLFSVWLNALFKANGHTGGWSQQPWAQPRRGKGAVPPRIVQETMVNI